MAQGRLAAEGDFRQIRELMDDRPHRLRVRTDDPRGLAAGLMDSGAVVGVRIGDEDRVLVDTIDAPAFRRSVAAVARERGARLYELVPLDEDLESVFRYLVGSP
jgi:ABC-2 type transport system ATP-binding protein